MKTRGLLAAVIVLAALAGGIYWSNYKQKTEAAKPATDAAPKILTIPEDQIKEVRLKKTGAETTVLRKGDDGKWQIVEPQAAARRSGRRQFTGEHAIQPERR